MATRRRRRRPAAQSRIPDLDGRSLERRLFDRAVLQSVQTARLMKGESDRLAQYWEEGFGRLEDAIRGRLERLKGRGQTSGVARTAAAREILIRTGQVIEEAGRRWNAAFRASMETAGRAEVRWAREALEDVVRLVQPSFKSPSISNAAIRNAVRAPVGVGAKGEAFLEDLTRDLTRSTATRAKRRILQGLSRGRSHDQIVRTLRTDVLETTKQHAETLVRTAINHTANMASEAVYSQSSVVIGVVWISTLDRRTTPICQDLDNETFRTGDGPRPPAHMRCRSRTSPLLRSPKDIAAGKLDGPVTDEMLAKAKARRRGTRAATNETTGVNAPVPVNQSYGEWLRTQPAVVQDQALGSAFKGRVYRRGKHEIREFRDADHVPLTDADLRARFPGI